MSNNLNLPQMAGNQAQKEVTHNDANAALDAAITEELDIDLTSGNATLTAAQYRGAAIYNVSGIATGGRTVTLPDVKKLAIFYSDPTNTDSFDIIKGSTTITVAAGSGAIIYTDGTTNGMIEIPTGGGGSSFINYGTTFRGVPGDGDYMLEYIMTEDMTLPEDLIGSLGVSGVAATAAASFSIEKNGTPIGTMDFAMSATTATFTLSADESFTAGDILAVTAPNPADATLADITFTLRGNR